MTSRNITPTRSATAAWSPINVDGDAEDAAVDSHPHTTPSTRKSSSILQEVSNSSLRRKGKKTPKRETLVAIFQDENAERDFNETSTTPWQRESSPAW